MAVSPSVVDARPVRSAARWIGCAAAVIVAAAPRAEVVPLDIRLREPFAGGRSFGPAGPYPSRAAYVERVAAAAFALQRDGFLLPEDALAAIEAASARRFWDDP